MTWFRKLFMSMKDECNGRLAPSIAVVCWMVLHTLHLHSSKYVLHSATAIVGPGNRLLLLLFMTLGETVVCAFALTLKNKNGHSSKTISENIECISLVVCSHTFGVFLNNVCLEDKEPGLGTAGTFLAPTVSVLLMYICTGHCISCKQYIGIIAIWYGLTFSTFDVTLLKQSNGLVVLNLLGSVFLMLRNICVKFLSDEKIQTVSRGPKTLTCLIVVMAIGSVALVTLVSLSWFVPIIVAAAALSFNICATYIVCGFLLARVSVPTVCLIESFACYLNRQFFIDSPVGNAGMVSAACVVLCVGVYLYWTENTTKCYVQPARHIVSTNEMLTRIQFLLFSCCIVGLIAGVFQPRVSQRDLHTLRYVGLDKIIPGLDAK